MRPLLIKLAAALLAAFVLATTGCTRGSGSQYIGPPLGSNSPEEVARLKNLINSQDLQFLTAEEYRIGPGDVLAIRLVGQPELFGEASSDKSGLFTVSQSKLITLPMVGAVQVHGRTVQELQDLLVKAYAEFFVNPVVIVTVEKYYQNQFSMVGSVVTPGKYELLPGDTAVDGIYRAGGLTFGGRTGGLAPGPNMILYRERLPQQQRLQLEPEELIRKLTDEDGLIRTRDEFRIPISDFLFRGVMTYNLPLKQNDIIYVVPAGSVNVMGRVQEPGVVFMGPSINTLAHVLSARGGLRYGASSRVEVVRTDEDGNPASYFLNARNITSRETEDFLLRDGDQVFVYSTPGRVILEYIAGVIGATTRLGVSATYNPVTGI